MNRISFTKMHGAGNDFILIDDRAGQFPAHDYMRMATFAARRTGVGCEGIILLQASATADFKMVFFNPDGTEADLCGNGTRCVAAFAHEIGVSKGKSMTFETRAGIVDAEVLDRNRVRVWLPEPKNRRYGLEVEVDGRIVKGDFIVTGVPHFVVPCESAVSVDVDTLGRALRLSPVFAPEGTNVDFVQWLSPDRAVMRTYERGVEAESGACGTGAAAVAVIGVEVHGKSSPMHIRTGGGFDLVIESDFRHGRVTGIILTGPVKKVYEGVIDFDDIEIPNEMN